MASYDCLEKHNLIPQEQLSQIPLPLLSLKALRELAQKARFSLDEETIFFFNLQKQEKEEREALWETFISRYELVTKVSLPTPRDPFVELREKFDWRWGKRFYNAFALRKKQTEQDYWRRELPGSRRGRALIREYEKIKDKLWQEWGREPAESEIAQEMDITQEELSKVKVREQGQSAAFLDKDFEPKPGRNEILPQLKDNAPAILSRLIQEEEFGEKLKKLLSKLSPREKEVLKMLDKGKKGKEIAVLFAVNPSMISHHITVILKKAERLGIVPQGTSQRQKSRLFSPKTIRCAQAYFLGAKKMKEISEEEGIGKGTVDANVCRLLQRLTRGSLSPSMREILERWGHSTRAVREEIEKTPVLKEELSRLLENLPVLTSCALRRNLSLKFYFGLGDESAHCQGATVSKYHFGLFRYVHILKKHFSINLKDAFEEYGDSRYKEGQPIENYFTPQQLKQLEELIDKLFPAEGKDKLEPIVASPFSCSSSAVCNRKDELIEEIAVLQEKLVKAIKEGMREEVCTHANIFRSIVNDNQNSLPARKQALHTIGRGLIEAIRGKNAFIILKCLKPFEAIFDFKLNPKSIKQEAFIILGESLAEAARLGLGDGYTIGLYIDVFSNHINRNPHLVSEEMVVSWWKISGKDLGRIEGYQHLDNVLKLKVLLTYLKYKSLARDSKVKEFVKGILDKIGSQKAKIVLMMAGAEGFEPIFQAAIEERELKGIDIVKLYSTSQIMDRIEENKYGFSYEDVVESLFGQEGLFKLNKGRVFFIDEIDGAIAREVEKIYNKFKSDEVEVNAWNFPNDEKGSMFCPAPHEYKGLEAIEMDEQGNYRLIFEKNDPERKILHHAVMLALRKGAEEVFKGEASSSILSGSRIKHSVFSMQNTKCDSRTTIHEQRRIAASGVESLDYLEKTRCGWSNRVTSGASPLICTCTIGCPSLSAFSAKERLYLDSSGLDSSTNTITASGEIFSASSGLSNKYFPNSVLSSIFFLINSSSLIFYLLQKLLSICSPVNFEFSIRKSKRFFEIRDVKGNLFLGSISMNDIFMGKPMGSIISYHWLPPILYIYLQLYGKTGNFIFPMSVNVPQLNIISQGNDIFNFFNHKLNIANFKEKVKTILFYAASPLEINTGVVHISLEAVKCDDPEDIFSERKGVRPLLRIDEFLEGITEKIYSAFEELSKRQVIKALQELGYFSLRQKETIAASPMKNKVSSALSAYQFSEEIRLVFLRRNVETYRMLERIEAIHFGYKGALCEKIKILNEKGVQPVKILDVGAGKGKFLTGLNKEAERRNLKIKTYALEVKSHNLLREKNSRIIWEESRWEESRITGYLPKKWQGKFDIVLGTYVLEYIYDPLRMIEEIYCALRPEGEVYLSLNLLNEDRYKECQEDIKKSWASEQCGIYKQRGKLYFENISFFTEISRLKKIGYSIGFCIKKGSMGKVVPEEVDQNLWDLFQLKGKQALETLWRQLARLNLFNLFASNWGCDYMIREKKNGKWEIFSIDAGGSFNFKTFERFKEQLSHLLKVGASYYLDCCPEVLINIADLHRDVIEKVIHGLFTEELMDWIGQKYPRLYASGINQDIRLFIYNSQALVNEVLANEIIQARKLVSSPIFFQGLGIKEKGLSIQYSEFSSKDPRLEIKNSELNRRLRRAEVRFGTQAWLVWGLAPAAPPIFLFYIFIVNNVSLRRLGSLRWAKTGPPSISRQSPAFSPQVVVPFFLLSTIPARGWFASGGNHQLLAIKSAASPVEADLHIHTIYSDGGAISLGDSNGRYEKGLKSHSYY